MTSSEHSSRDSEHRPCIVVIDDNARLCQLLALRFEKAGFAVRAAATEIALQRILAGTRPDALLIDLQRSEREGLRLLARMRARVALRGVPILFLAGSDHGDFRRQALEAGADWFGLRPQGLIDLQARVAELIAHPTAQEANQQRVS
jgi:DNA-binding response OmpR family regulator